METLWSTIVENARFLAAIALTAAVILCIARLGEMIWAKKPKESSNSARIVTIGMMAALAMILQMFDFPLLFIAPGFYKLDFSEVPVLICSFAMGPVAGVTCELLKNILKVLFRGTSTAFVGDFANFAVGCSFIVPASIVYLKHKTKKMAIAGCIVGTIVITIFGTLFNAYYLLPAFAKIYGMSMESILEMGHAIFSGFKSFDIAAFVIVCVAPMNLIKGISVSVIVMLIYKPVSRMLHRL